MKYLSIVVSVIHCQTVFVRVPSDSQWGSPLKKWGSPLRNGGRRDAWISSIINMTIHSRE